MRVNALLPSSSSKALLLTRSRGCNATTVARGPSFFSLLLRKAGGWIVSRRRRTAWMEGMLAARDGRLLWRGAAPRSLAAALRTTTKLPPRVRHGVLPPLGKGPSPPLGRRASAQRRGAEALPSLGVSWSEGRRSETAPGVWPRARLARHALAGLASHSPSRGTSLCCSESLAAPAERHREERPPGCPKAVDAYTFVETTPPAHRRASQCTVP